jgi:hypothetical protein
MRRTLFYLLLTFTITCIFAITGPAQCAKIQGGTITDSASQAIRVGYDQWGYNYQAHMFNGLYDNFLRPPVPLTSGDVNLIMKWSDDWISNLDCDHNGKLDRGG